MRAHQWMYAVSLRQLDLAALKANTTRSLLRSGVCIGFEANDMFSCMYVRGEEERER